MILSAAALSYQYPSNAPLPEHKWQINVSSDAKCSHLRLMSDAKRLNNPLLKHGCEIVGLMSRENMEKY